MALRRITKELKDIENGTPPFVLYAGPSGDDLFNWKAVVRGTKGTPYAGGQYALSIKFPQDYPFKPPKIKFDTKIYHCNINDKGGIDCDILKDNWSPALTIGKLLLSLETCMVTGGNVHDPLVFSIAKLMKGDLESFMKTAAEWNVRYAEGDPAPAALTDSCYPNFLPWTEYVADKAAYRVKYADHDKADKAAADAYHATRFNADEIDKHDMLIFVKTLSGRTYSLKCRHNDFIRTVQLLLARESHVALDRQKKLIFAGKELQPYRRLSDYNICKESTLHLVLHLRDTCVQLLT